MNLVLEQERQRYDKQIYDLEGQVEYLKDQIVLSNERLYAKGKRDE